MKIERVLLIAPPARTFRSAIDINPMPPMGLGYLASVVEDMGIEVRILDCLMSGWCCREELGGDFIKIGLSNKDVVEYLNTYDPAVVGVNCQFSRQHRTYHDMFALIKNTLPECFVVAGGAHTTVCPDDVLQDPNCDYVLIGEAEETFRDLLINIERGGDLDHIDGLGWKVRGDTKLNAKCGNILNLDSVKYPAYHLMDLHKYHGLRASHGLRHRKRHCPIITSRGCPAKCSFCSAHKVWGKRFRARSVDNVIEEMRLLRTKYEIEELIFEDDNVTANPRRAKELFKRMIAERFDFVWDTPNGVGMWSVDEEMIDLMKESGCVRLNFPVESGSQRVLDDIIRKPLKLDKIKKLIQHCKDINLEYGMFLIMGLPGETIDDMWTSVRFAADCGCYVPHISVATPYPGTDLLDECVKYNYLAKKFELDDLFIRSFTIKTDEWNAEDVRRVLFRGRIYLLIRELMRNPAHVVKRALGRIQRFVFERGIH